MDLATRLDQIWAEIRAVLDGLDEAAFQSTARAIHEAPRVFVAGAGRSGLLMRMFAMRLAQAGLAVHVAGDATTPALRTGDCLVIASGSGETASMRVLQEKARAAGGRILLLSYRPDSTLVQRADHALLFPVPLEPSRPGGLAGSQVLGSLFDQSAQLACALLVEQIIILRGESHEAMAARHANLE